MHDLPQNMDDDDDDDGEDDGDGDGDDDDDDARECSLCNATFVAPV